MRTVLLTEKKSELSYKLIITMCPCVQWASHTTVTAAHPRFHPGCVYIELYMVVMFMSPPWLSAGGRQQSDLWAELQSCNSHSAQEECGNHHKSHCWLQAVVSVFYVCSLICVLLHTKTAITATQLRSVFCKQ